MSIFDKLKKAVTGKNSGSVAQCFTDALRKSNTAFSEQPHFGGGTRITVPFENSEIVCVFSGEGGRNVFMRLPYARVPRERIFDVCSFCGDYNSGPHMSRCNVEDFNGEYVFCIEREECISASVTPDEAAAKAFWNLEMLKHDSQDIKMRLYRILLR